jgi:hypothetical protein
MKKVVLFYRLALVGFILFISVPVDAQFVTIARKVKSMRTSSADIATVIIDAGATNVYRAVIDTLTTDPKFTITQRDNSRSFVEFSRESYIISIQVDSMAVNLSQITVASAAAGRLQMQPTDMAVDAIFRICEKAGVKCTID